MRNAMIANAFISQGWVVVPPKGCVVRARCPEDARTAGAPVTGTVARLHVDPDGVITLVLTVAGCEGSYYTVPEEVEEIVSAPRQPNAHLWWRRPRRMD